ncbi:hypothetical protein NVP1101O_005 [Vibrio phage 1.101.O._10N.261.45.C6]|nr:hypothetical protein NVP1101O_005 [Vibrio phage 1.101.O._10N.261.45.C6]
MKIIEGRIVKPVPLEELKGGDVFLFENDYYMKTIGFVKDVGHLGVVNLETGDRFEMLRSEQVVPVEAELHIK